MTRSTFTRVPVLPSLLCAGLLSSLAIGHDSFAAHHLTIPVWSLSHER